MIQDHDAEKQVAGFHPHQGRMLAGGILMLVGSLLWAVGSMIAGTEFAISARRWLREQQEPASVIALTRLHQARVASHAATQAAMAAWHDGEHASPAR